jgi:peptide/nickel transport system substrate-binding protein
VLPSWLYGDRRLAASQSSDLIVPSGPTAPSGDPVRDANVVVGTTLEPDSLHPWEARTLAAFDVLDGVMDGLLRYTSEGKLAPALAEQFGISDDGLVYTFRLRQDVRYHNGEPFSGDDFIAAWELSQRREFDVLSTLGWQKIDNAELVDDTTLVVTTTEPYAPFLSTVATTYLCPRASLSEGVDSFREVFADTPIGTGPFRITGRERGAGIELGRWDDYWGSPAKLKSVRVRILTDAEALLNELERGEIHVAGGGGGVPAGRVEDALGLPDVDVFQLGTMNWQHVDLKQMAYLRETPVRQALDFATPRERIVGDLLAGHAVPAFADQSPVSWAYSETLQPRSFDPGQAAKLLDDAGLVVGDDGVRVRDGKRFEVELWGVEGDQTSEAIIGAIAREWNAIGVSTLPQSAPPDRLWGPLGYQYSDRMTGCLYTWTNANDPDDLFYWHSSQIPSSPGGSGGNLPAYFYPYAFQDDIDSLTVDAASELDFGRRQELYGEIQALLAREVPVIFLCWEQAFPASRNTVGGFWPSAWTPLFWNVAAWYLVSDDS